VEADDVARNIAALLADVEAANERLARLGIGRRIDPHLDTVYTERRIQLRLLDRRYGRRDVAGALFRLLWAIARDPHYPWVERLVLIATYGIGWILPRELRTRWLAGSRSPMPLLRPWRRRSTDRTSTAGRR
jgi:hypothetical protein